MSEAEGDAELVGLDSVVRGLIAARVGGDPHLVEDLTQETLVRVAAARPRLVDEAVRAYAVVTARHIVAAHARADSVQQRHAHRLVEPASPDGPEHVVLAREETTALATALDRVSPAERELLLRYEADDVDIGSIADDASSTRGSIAMRLSRARAVLRLEFVLVFRRVELPTARCRAVLLALSAGDRRRQRHLDAAGHLLRCETCSHVARAVTERNRGIAAWLILPVAEAMRRVGPALRRNRTAQVAAGVLVAAAVVGVALVVTSRGQPDTESAPASGGQSTLAAPTTFEPEDPPAAAPIVAPTEPSSAAPSSTTPCPVAAPLGAVEPTSIVGCPFSATPLTVVEVLLDEGFWATTATEQTVWVQLLGSGESPFDVEPGLAISVAGVVVAAPGDAAELGLGSGDPRIAELGWYLQIRFEDVQIP